MVGPNASGKPNLPDALWFRKQIAAVGEGLRTRFPAEAAWRGSTSMKSLWIPAFAGMAGNDGLSQGLHPASIEPESAS